MSENEKFVLTDEVIEYEGHTLHRIKALRDIHASRICKDCLGGFVENDQNLCWDDDSWIGVEAKVVGDSTVQSNALVTDKAVVIDSLIDGGSVSDNAVVKDSCVFGYVSDSAQVISSSVGKSGSVTGSSFVTYGDINGSVMMNATVKGGSKYGGEVQIGEGVWLMGSSRVESSAAFKIENGELSGDALVSPEHPYSFISVPQTSDDAVHNITLTESNGKFTFNGMMLSYNGVIEILDSYRFDHEITEADKQRVIKAMDCLILMMKAIKEV